MRISGVAILCFPRCGVYDSRMGLDVGVSSHGTTVFDGFAGAGGRAVERDGLSRREAAARFGLGVSTVISWLRRYRDTGSVCPGQMGGHKPRKICGDHRIWLLTRCRGRDFTLRGLVVELGERGLAVDYRSVWEFVCQCRVNFPH